MYLPEIYQAFSEWFHNLGSQTFRPAGRSRISGAPGYLRRGNFPAVIVSIALFPMVAQRPVCCMGSCC
jgi:hypothetical protein